MKIKILTPPEEAYSCVKEELKELAEMKKSEHLIGGYGLPHPIHTIGLNDLVNLNDISQIKHIAWRFLLGSKDEAHAALEVAISRENNEGHHFHHINRGPFVQGTLNALKELRELDVPGEFEFHVIRIPAIFIMAIWLKSMDDSESYFYALEPTHHVIKPNSLVHSNEFFETLIEPAAEQLKMDKY